MKSVSYTRAEYGVRSDGSIWISFGDPRAGPHEQFDFDGSEELAVFLVGLVTARAFEEQKPSTFDRCLNG